MQDASVFEFVDDICPPWWPRWWRRPKWPPPPPPGLDRLEQLHLTLAIHELASQLKDQSLMKQIQDATGPAIGKEAGSLGG
jgi:hypothetical protein